MEKIKEALKKTTLGEVQTYKNMKVIPLMGQDSRLNYLTLDDALRSGLMINETGSVPTLHFKNNTGQEVLLLQGEYVIGGKQNRMLAANVYLAKDFDGNVPVRCVEQGRWNYGGSNYVSGNLHNLEDAPIFKSSNHRVSIGVMQASFSGQGEVWNAIKGLSAEHGVHSHTQNLNDVYKNKAQDINEYISKFSYMPGSIGVVVAFEKENGFIEYGVDMFDQGKTMQNNFRKILESYAVEAIKERKDKISSATSDVKDFLVGLEKFNFQERKAVSLGNDYMLVGTKDIYNGAPVGFALEYADNTLYLSFSNKKPGQGSIRPRPEPIIPELPDPWRPRPDPHTPWVRPDIYGPIHPGWHGDGIVYRTKGSGVIGTLLGDNVSPTTEPFEQLE